MSNIKNLRAMFEQNNKSKETASPPPPERGRPPGEPILFSPGTSTTPPRPLSKVRTSFVTVERSAPQPGQPIQLGLKRQDSNIESNMASNGSMAKRRTSFSMDGQSHPQETAERKKSISQEFEARKASLVDELIPESALAETPVFEVDKQIGDPEPIKGPMPERGRELAEPAEIKENPKKSAEEPKALDGNRPAVTSNKIPASGASSSPRAAPTSGSSKITATPKNSDKATRTKSVARPAPISTAKSSITSKPSPRTTSPLKSSRSAPKTPTTPTGSPGQDGKVQKSKTPERKPAIPAKTPDKKPAKKTSSNSLATSSGARASSKPRSTSRPAAKTRIPPSSPQSGFNKPKARSPTRPLQLPASLTAPTASSGSKGVTSAPPARQTQSRASGAIKAEAAPRSQSRAGTGNAPKLSHPPVSRSASSLKKHTTRPSLGPPSTLQKKTSTGNLPPVSAPLVEDGFLSRMMRPTASSASKTSEKSPPPRRSLSIKRPSSSLGQSKVHDTKTASHAVQKATRPTTTKAAAPKSTAPAAKTGTKTVVKKSADLPQQVAKEQAKEVKETPEEEPTSTNVETVPEIGDATTENAEVEPEVEKTTPTPVDAPAEKEVEAPATQEEPLVVEEPIKEAEVSESLAVEEPTKEAEVPESIIVEEPAKEAEVSESIAVEEPAKEAEVSEPTAIEAAPASPAEEDTTEPVAPGTEEPEVEEEEKTIRGVPSSEEPFKIDTPPPTFVEPKPEDDEDPEDAAARAEIARINAEMMAALASK
ncbi:hypothetical protein NHQ30_011106 [Ciborinia camelliae]|nr:hypothetical protein NHQ30_011106 [Ciborinia camelliae]